MLLTEETEMLKRFPLVRRVLAGAAIAALATGVAFAQEAPKPEEVPFWAIGKPKSDAGGKLAPVPSFPIATAVD